MSPARVLVVDDTPANVKLLIDVLTAKGYELSSATNGADALAMRRRAARPGAARHHDAGPVGLRRVPAAAGQRRHRAAAGGAVHLTGRHAGADQWRRSRRRRLSHQAGEPGRAAGALGLAYPAALHGQGQVSVVAFTPYLNPRQASALAHPHGPLHHWPNCGLDGHHPQAVPQPVEDQPKDWIDQPEGRALTRKMQGLIKAHERQQLICMAAAQPGDSGAADLCSSSLAVGLENRLLEDRLFKRPFAFPMAPRPRQNTAPGALESVFEGGRRLLGVDGSVGR